MSRTYEELKAGFERIEAAQACRNLMGKYSYLHTAMRNIDFMKLWANREDDILAMPWGYYLGIEGVRKCYLEDHGDRSDPMVQASPIFKGGMMMHAMDTAVIEVAKDGKTAKGVWLSPGHESCYIRISVNFRIGKKAIRFRRTWKSCPPANGHGVNIMWISSKRMANGSSGN